jgi:hypothetical protein
MMYQPQPTAVIQRFRTEQQLDGVRCGFGEKTKKKDSKFVPRKPKYLQKFATRPDQNTVLFQKPEDCGGLKRKGRAQTRPLTATVDELNEGSARAPVHRGAGPTL